MKDKALHDYLTRFADADAQTQAAHIAIATTWLIRILIEKYGGATAHELPQRPQLPDGGAA